MGFGQATIETLGAVLVVLVLFMFSVWLFSQINESAILVDKQSNDWSECLRIASIVQEVFVQGSGTQIQISASRDFNISKLSVYFENASCEFTGLVLPTGITAGTVRVQNQNGIVVLQNV